MNSKQEDTVLSRKFHVLSFWAMLSVIVIHSKALSGNPATWDIFVQWLFTRALAKWAVPFFFATTGFWFGKSLRQSRTTIEIWRNKSRTLLLPYIIWAILGMALCLPLICFNNHVTNRPLLERTVFGHATAWECINDLLGLTIHAPGGNAVLWYVRSILVFFLFTPLWKILYGRIPMALLLLGVVFAIVPGGVIPGLAISTDWWAWILIGLAIERFSAEREKAPTTIIASMGIGYLVLCLIEACFEAKWMSPSPFRVWGRRLIPCFGVPFFWWLYDLLPNNHRTLPRWMKLTFWYYCIHQTFTGYYMAAMFFLLGKSDAVLIALMITTPFVGLTLSVISALLAESLVPQFFLIASGGRTQKSTVARSGS